MVIKPLGIISVKLGEKKKRKRICLQKWFTQCSFYALHNAITINVIIASFFPHTLLSKWT